MIGLPDIEDGGGLALTGHETALIYGTCAVALCLFIAALSQVLA